MGLGGWGSSPLRSKPYKGIEVAGTTSVAESINNEQASGSSPMKRKLDEGSRASVARLGTAALRVNTFSALPTASRAAPQMFS